MCHFCIDCTCRPTLFLALFSSVQNGAVYLFFTQVKTKVHQTFWWDNFLRPLCLYLKRIVRGQDRTENVEVGETGRIWKISWVRFEPGSPGLWRLRQLVWFLTVLHEEKIAYITMYCTCQTKIITIALFLCYTTCCWIKVCTVMKQWWNAWRTCGQLTFFWTEFVQYNFCQKTSTAVFVYAFSENPTINSGLRTFPWSLLDAPLASSWLLWMLPVSVIAVGYALSGAVRFQEPQASGLNRATWWRQQKSKVIERDCMRQTLYL